MKRRFDVHLTRIPAGQPGIHLQSMLKSEFRIVECLLAGKMVRLLAGKKATQLAEKRVSLLAGLRERESTVKKLAR